MKRFLKYIPFHQVFEYQTRSGSDRDDKAVEKERFDHYLSHFRETLIGKHPKSFANSTPSKCSKCPYRTTIKSIKKEDHHDREAKVDINDILCYSDPDLHFVGSPDQNPQEIADLVSGKATKIIGK